ncbi:pentatricopeptide repeat protein, putative [Plasmodium malariae]|uniref:Pentatricopeptide repeat protein, putative n=1 Tax=Plasmodium malariae TaxID=5858 RepID=A0A1A8WDW5_PLAMA|nr:pentatricopeptide repeat protein, putative [Plasmodium malariae]
MNCSVAYSYFKLSGGGKVSVVCSYYIHNLYKLNNVRKSHSITLGQLTDRKKNVINLKNNDDEIVRSYKRVNIKKILKDDVKTKQGKSIVEMNSRRNKILVNDAEDLHSNFKRYDVHFRNIENEEAIGENICQQYKELQNNTKLSASLSEEKSVDKFKFNNTLEKEKKKKKKKKQQNEKEKEAIHDENIKDTVDELFFAKEKKKNLMKRIIFRNNYDYMDLIDKYEAFKENEEDRFYNSDNFSNSSSVKDMQNEKGKEHFDAYEKGVSSHNTNNKLIDSDKTNNIYPHIYEVESENNDTTYNINMQFKFFKNNLNISIFPEIGKKDIIETCKRRRNMQNEINKNSNVKNIFNNDIYFWLKRKIHRSVGWQLTTPFSENRDTDKDDIIDVTEMRCDTQDEDKLFIAVSTRGDVWHEGKKINHNSGCSNSNSDNDNDNNNSNNINIDNNSCNNNNNSCNNNNNSCNNNNNSCNNNNNSCSNNNNNSCNNNNNSCNNNNNSCNNNNNSCNNNNKNCNNNNKNCNNNNKNCKNNGASSSSPKDAENFLTHAGERNNKIPYMQKKIAPSNFLAKLNINMLEDGTHGKRYTESKENQGDDKAGSMKEIEGERLMHILLHNCGGVHEKSEIKNEHCVGKEASSDDYVLKEATQDQYVSNEAFLGQSSSKEGVTHQDVEKNDAVLITERKEFEEERPALLSDETYEGILDSSKNIFKKIKENYEMFKKESISPYLLEGCEKYINYYYGIEKEEKIREMKKYANLNFYDVIQNENFTIDHFNMLIKSKIIFNKEEEAFNYFNLLKKYDFKINVDTYNSLMYTSVVQKNAKLSRLIYLQMIKDLFIPNKNTYCILMKAHILDGDIRSAFHLYRKMVKEEIEVDLPIYSTLVDGLIKHKLYKRAEQFFNYIVTYKNVVPDEILYSILIKKCSYCREAEKCLNYYDAMLTNNLRITDITLIEIINCLSKREDYFHKVFHFYNIYLANDMKINHRLMLYMIVACSNSGNIKRLKEILKTMNKHKIKITNEMYYYIIRAFANNCRGKNITLSEKNNNIKYAWRVIYDLVRRTEVGHHGSGSINGGRSNNRIGVNTMKGNMDQQLDDEYKEMNEKNIIHTTSKYSSVSTKMLNSIVMLYINSEYYEYSINMLKYYTYFNCMPDHYTFKMLYRMLFFHLRDYGKVICLYNYMTSNTDIKADEYTFNLVLNAAIKTKSSKNTLFILRHMFAAKVYPTPRMVKKLFYVARHITEIQLLINSMISQQKKDVYEENVKENQLIQLHIDEYELNLFKQGKTFKTKSELDQVRDQFFKRKQRIEKDKRMSKNKKSSDWLPYGQYLQHKKKGGETYARKVDRPRPLPFD